MTSKPDPTRREELDKYRIETNGIYYSFGRTLITLAVLVVTVSPVFVGQQIENATGIVFFKLAIGLALMSVITGITQMYIDHMGFSDYVKYMTITTYKSPASYTNEEKALLDKYSKLYEKEMTFNTGMFWFRLQISSAILALIMLYCAVLTGF